MEYTELIWDRYLDSFDSELAQLWDLIGSNLLKAAPSARVAVLKKTVVDFSYSSRFMLMRLLQARAGSDGGFEYVGEGIRCSFTDISADHASSMSAEESEAYERVLADIALRYEQDAEYSRHLITKAWHTPESYEKSWRKRQALQRQKGLPRKCTGQGSPGMRLLILAMFSVSRSTRCSSFSCAFSTRASACALCAPRI